MHETLASQIVPQNYVGKKVEVLLYAADEVVEELPIRTKNTMAKFWGVLSDETAADIRNNI